jgi:hypothetical protein
LAKRDPKLSPQARRSIERVVDDVLAGKRAPAAGDPVVVAKNALDDSIASIMNDGDVSDVRVGGALCKADMIAESVQQFVDYLVTCGVDPDAAERSAAEVVATYTTAVVKQEIMSMSKSSRCPSCGQKMPDPPDDDEDTGKRLDPDTIMKGAVTSADSIIADFRKRMPGASEGAIMTAATSSPEFMKLHLDERRARQTAMGNL